MKKSIVLGFAVIMTLAVSVTAFASASKTHSECNRSEAVQVNVTSQGSGSCRHAGCKCTWYVRAQGGAGKCVCGHWDYVHN